MTSTNVRSRKFAVLVSAVLVFGGLVALAYRWSQSPSLLRRHVLAPRLPVDSPWAHSDTWLAEAIRSPNYNYRSPTAHIDTIVLHSTATDSLWCTVNGFRDPHVRRSAHFVVGKDGTVIQMVSLEHRAWHAGLSEIDGHMDVNTDSVGIEMVNANNGADPYTTAQYHAVAKLVAEIQKRYGVHDSHIVSHADIARPIGRKNDPLGFNFPRLLTLVHADEAAPSIMIANALAKRPAVTPASHKVAKATVGKPTAIASKRKNEKQA